MAESTSNYLLEILNDLIDNDVEFIVCGGVALVLHGVERMTVDLDLSLNFKKENMERFLTVMKKAGLVPRAPVPAESLMNDAQRQLMISEKNALVFTFIDPAQPFRQVDIFLSDSHAYRSLEKDMETMLIQNRPVQVVGKERLIELKKLVDPPREKDLFDIKQLEKIIEQDE